MSELKYLTGDIEELEATENELEKNGVPRSHIHILGENDTDLQNHNLPVFSEWSKRDTLYYGLRGALLGIVLSSAILIGGVLYGVTDPSIWLVLAFVSSLCVGFCTWEGGLVGLNKLNHAFSQYKDAIKNGEYLLVVSADSNKEEQVTRYTLKSHPVLRAVD